MDRVAEYSNARLCNIHSAQPVGTRAYFDEVERRKYFVEPHIPGFAEFARWQGRRVLSQAPDHAGAGLPVAGALFWVAVVFDGRDVLTGHPGQA